MLEAKAGQRLGAERRPLVEGRVEEAHYSALVSNADIGANGYNIAVSSYVEQADTSEAVDIRELNEKISGIVARQTELRKQIDAIVADLEGAQA